MIAIAMLLAFFNSPPPMEPMDGCSIAWQYPDSDGAMDCRLLGYTVTPEAVYDSTGEVVGGNY